jgi:hypothetical protein
MLIGRFTTRSDNRQIGVEGVDVKPLPAAALDSRTVRNFGFFRTGECGSDD